MIEKKKEIKINNIKKKKTGPYNMMLTEGLREIACLFWLNYKNEYQC